MKTLRIINAVLICGFLSALLVPIVLIAFPFLTLMELIFLIVEFLGEDGFYHNLWPTFISKCVCAIRDVYRKMME